ncbi:TPA: hypothetical protein JD335_15560 [Citrobacter freundii]|nr:hypothetical protein [Citrobacter freundii]
MVEVIRWYQIWLIEFVLDVSWVMLTKLLGVYCVGVYYWNIGVYALIYINNPSRINTQHSGQIRFDISLC